MYFIRVLNMSQLTLLVCLLFVTITTTQSIPYSLIWHDEFDGMTLNTTNWIALDDNSGGGKLMIMLLI